MESHEGSSAPRLHTQPPDVDKERAELTRKAAQGVVKAVRLITVIVPKLVCYCGFPTQQSWQRMRVSDAGWPRSQPLQSSCRDAVRG